MIRLNEVAKEYGGALGGVLGRRVRALEGVSLEVPPGTALGIVGPNGAGKSTLLRLLLGYLRPTAGEVTIAELAPRAYAERHGIGYVPENVAIPPRWTVRGALRAYAALGEVENAAGRIEEEMQRLGIEALAERRVSTLSKGNLQRLALAQALLGERRLMILDEPTDGIDPEWTARVRELLSDWREADPARVLLLASHNLDEVERVADRVAVLGEGRLRELIELRAPAPTTALPAYRLEVEGEPGTVAPLVREVFPDAAAADGAPLAFRVTAPDLPTLNRQLGHFLERGGILRSLAPERQSLEQQFRRAITAGEREGGRGKRGQRPPASGHTAPSPRPEGTRPLSQVWERGRTTGAGGATEDSPESPSPEIGGGARGGGTVPTSDSRLPTSEGGDAP